MVRSSDSFSPGSGNCCQLQNFLLSPLTLTDLLELGLDFRFSLCSSRGSSNTEYSMLAAELRLPACPRCLFWKHNRAKRVGE